MFRSPAAVLPCLLASLAVISGCGGGNGGAAVSASDPGAVSASQMAYSQSLVLKNFEPRPIVLIDAQGTTAVQLVVSAASTFLPVGKTSVVAVHRSANGAGALLACVSAPTSSTGNVDGINLGVNVKSVAALMDATWFMARDQNVAWAQLVAARKIFEGWENCGAKPEGLPSPSSRRAINADGGFSEDVYDGNPSTNLNIITLHFSPAQVAQMLSPQGYLDTTQSAVAKRIRLRVYQNNSGQTVLIEQGTPDAGLVAPTAGYLAEYFMERQAASRFRQHRAAAVARTLDAPLPIGFNDLPKHTITPGAARARLQSGDSANVLVIAFRSRT